MNGTELWTYREQGWTGVDLTGFHVEAIDGGIGKVDEAAGTFLVIDTGPWIFGKKVALPAGVVDHVDPDDRKIYVNRAKDDIKGSPDFDPESSGDGSYRDELGGYYSELETPDELDR